MSTPIVLTPNFSHIFMGNPMPFGHRPQRAFIRKYRVYNALRKRVVRRVLFHLLDGGGTLLQENLDFLGKIVLVQQGDELAENLNDGG